MRAEACRKRLPNSVQPGCSLSFVNDVVDSAKDAPSSEVKHVALELAPLEMTLVTPVGAMFSSPGVASHMSTGTFTYFDGRKAGGKMKGTLFVLLLLVEMAPLKYTTPETSAIAGLADPE